MIFRKTKYWNFSLLMIIGLMSVTIISCTKQDDTYYKFVNREGSYNGNAIDYLKSQNGIYDSMLLAIDRVTGLEDSIIAGNVTVFAVTNSSFTLALKNLNEVRSRNIPVRPALSIASLDSAQLDTLMYRYVIRGIFSSDSVSQFADGLTLSTVRYGYLMQVQYQHANSSGYEHGGPEYLSVSDRNESIFERYWVTTTTIAVDIQTNNSVVYILSPGHDFGFGQIVDRMNK